MPRVLVTGTLATSDRVCLNTAKHVEVPGLRHGWTRCCLSLDTATMAFYVRFLCIVAFSDGSSLKRSKVKEIIVLIKARSFLDELNLEHLTS